MRGWALTGGIAVELHCLRHGCAAAARALNDIDFLASSFAEIPVSLGDDFLFHHVHPLEPPGKTMLQCVDAESAVRIDVFRAYGNEMDRAVPLELAGCATRLVSLEDLTARMARLALDLARGESVPAKHAHDFLRLAELAEAEKVEGVWAEHRKPWHPVGFEESAQLLRDLIPERRHLLVERRYGKDTGAVCGRCRSGGGFELADPSVVLSILGYV